MESKFHPIKMSTFMTLNNSRMVIFKSRIKPHNLLLYKSNANQAILF